MRIEFKDTEEFNFCVDVVMGTALFLWMLYVIIDGLFPNIPL